MPTSKGFTGQRADAATGLDYYGARYCDPVLGQFTSADDVLPGDGLDPWGLSRYAYVEGNPISRSDPTGHCWPMCAIMAAVVVGLVAATVDVAVQAVHNHGDPSKINWGQVAAVGVGAAVVTGAVLLTGGAVLAAGGAAAGEAAGAGAAVAATEGGAIAADGAAAAAVDGSAAFGDALANAAGSLLRDAAVEAGKRFVGGFIGGATPGVTQGIVHEGWHLNRWHWGQILVDGTTAGTTTALVPGDVWPPLLAWV